MLVAQNRKKAVGMRWEHSSQQRITRGCECFEKEGRASQ